MDSFHARLLAWYDRHARTLPWRVGPHDGKQGVVPDPYHVWLSEVMLQQTTVATVKAYFEKFISTWPSVNDLAAASSEDVMKAWAGLGYYSRARNLKACADIVAAELGGRFPETQGPLRALPGIGDYTSAAIAAIAFNKRTIVVDGNIERVSTRHAAISTSMPKAKDECRSFMDDVTPVERPGDFVQAMMDLGATICTPKNPACSLCPINVDCTALAAGTMLNFPAKGPKKSKPNRKGAAYVLQRNDGAVWLMKRPVKGLLGGMTGLPTTDWTVSRDGDTGTDAAPVSGNWKACGSIRHTFTHFHLELEVWHCEYDGHVDCGWWSAVDEISDEALPTIMRKAVTAALPETFKPKRETA